MTNCPKLWASMHWVQWWPEMDYLGPISSWLSWSTSLELGKDILGMYQLSDHILFSLSVTATSPASSSLLVILSNVSYTEDYYDNAVLFSMWPCKDTTHSLKGVLPCSFVAISVFEFTLKMKNKHFRKRTVKQWELPEMYSPRLAILIF